MFERFTDRARSTVVRAQEQARRFGHGHLGTEHLLLALLAEPDGLAAGVLGAMGVRIASVEADVVAIVGFGNVELSGHVPFTERARMVLQQSPREARLLGHDYVEPEHILLGIVRNSESVAAQVLMHTGATLDAVRDRVVAQLREAARPRRRSTVIARTPAAQGVLLTAEGLAGASPLGSHHLLAALLTAQGSMAAQALAALGIDRAAVEAALDELRLEDTTDATPE
jgi:ATP-dependent Clp protease ATP-binding subunit ClpC